MSSAPENWPFMLISPLSAWLCEPSGKQVSLPGNIKSSQLYGWAAADCWSWKEPIVLMKNVIKILSLTLCGCLLAHLFGETVRGEWWLYD